MPIHHWRDGMTLRMEIVVKSNELPYEINLAKVLLYGIALPNFTMTYHQHVILRK